MKRTYLLFAGIIILFSSLYAAAQTPPIATPKVAVIYTEAFRDEKSGVKTMVAALKTLDTESQPRRQKLQTLYNQRKQIETDVRSGGSTLTQAQIAEKSSQFDQLGITIKREEEDTQAFLNQRMAQLVGPINQELGNDLKAFAKKNNIDLVIDLSKISDGVYLFNDAADITAVFIASVNAKGAKTTTP